MQWFKNELSLSRIFEKKADKNTKRKREDTGTWTDKPLVEAKVNYVL